MEKKTTEIAEYSVTTAELAKLKIKLKDAKYDVATTAGMNTAKQDRHELVKLRTSLEAKRKEIKAPALAHCKLIDDEAKRITAELLALEIPIDEQIKAEEKRKADEKAERERLAAEAQKILDDKISAIGQLPLKIIGKDSGKIELFLSTLEAREFGAEFTGDTLERAKAAKQGAVDTIRQALVDTKEAEEKAAQVERERIEREAKEAEERKVEAERLEAERIEREKQEAIRKAEFERQQAELAEERKKQAEAQRLIDEANAAEQKRLDAIRAADEKKLAEERAKIEAERKEHEAKLRAEQEAADKKRREEEAEKLRIASEKAAKEEEARKAAEKARKLAEAKCVDAKAGFKRILDLCNSGKSDSDVRTAVALVAEAML